MIGDALAAAVAAIEAHGLRVALRSGDITPPVVYIQIGTATDMGGPLEGGRIPTFWAYYIPVRGLDNATGDAAALDALYDALSPITAAEMVVTRTSVTVNNETWPAYRADAAILALDPSEVP